jgi:hypothetical protein
MKSWLIRTVSGAVLLLAVAVHPVALLRAQEATPPPALPVEPVEASPLQPLPPRQYSGPAVAIDAVTLLLEGEILKLYGLRGFPGDWRADAVARVALEIALGEVPPECFSAGHDRFRRALVSCSTETGDLAETMLNAGMAVVDRQTTNAPMADPALAERYDAAERTARERSAGLWASVPGFEPPPPETPAPPEPDILDSIERFQAGLAVLIGMIAVAFAVRGRRAKAR